MFLVPSPKPQRLINKSIEITICFTCVCADSVSTLHMPFFNMGKFISYLPEVPG